MRIILVIDSDPAAALVTQRGLQHLLGSQVQVEVAPSPGAAWLRCLHEAVELVIVDPSPRSRGAAALLKALHETHPSIPVLVLTAYDTPRLRAQMRALGVVNYLAKPVDLLELKQVVSGALNLRGPEEHAVVVKPSPGMAAD
jgi:two-component system, OmpR family, response regulator